MCEHPNNPYYTDTTMFKYWSKEILCGGGNLQLGSCNNHGECICKAGYTHDMTFARYRTCNLPIALLPTWFGLQLAFSVGIFYIVFKSFRDAASLARSVLLSNMICLLFHMLYCIFQFSFDFKANGWMVVSLFIIVTCLSASSILVLYSLMLPLSAAARKSKKLLKKIIVCFFTVFRLIEAIPILIALILYDDINDPTKDKGWNTMVHLYTLFVAIEAISLTCFLVIGGTRMIQSIRQLSENLGSLNEARTKMSQSYLAKVQLMIQRSSLLLVPMTMTLCTAPLLQIVTNYVPFNYILSTLALGIAPLASYSTSMYATKSSQKVSSVSNRDPTNTPQVMVMVRPQTTSSFEYTVRSENGNLQSNPRVISLTSNKNNDNKVVKSP